MQVVLPWPLIKEIGACDVIRDHDCQHECVYF